MSQCIREDAQNGHPRDRKMEILKCVRRSRAKCKFTFADSNVNAKICEVARVRVKISRIVVCVSEDYL